MSIVEIPKSPTNAKVAPKHPWPVVNASRGTVTYKGKTLPLDIAAHKYGNSDGLFTGLEKLLMQYDLDQDGHYSAAEVRALVGDFMKQQAKVKNLKRVVFMVLFLAMVACGVMLGIVVGANEASKESHVSGNAMVGLDGGAVQVDACESFADMRSFLDRSAEEMAKLDYVEFATGNCEGISAGVGVSETVVMKVTLQKRTGDTLTLFGPDRSIALVIKSDSMVFVDGDSTTSLCLSDEKHSTRRLSSRRELFGFGGMMTSGSFMMMSSGF